MTAMAASALRENLLAQVDSMRTEAVADLDQERRALMGQVMTPASVASLMASMLAVPRPTVKLLDPGAGIGSLTAAAVGELLRWDDAPSRIEVVAYEVESTLVPYLEQTLGRCHEACTGAGVEFTAQVEVGDFLTAAARLYARGEASFTTAILNPPYRKMRTESDERQTCRTMGLEVSNLYAAFVGATVHLLEDGAEMVAITPRSFANGAYFRDFRSFLLERMALRRLHAFDSRSHAFRDDAVLQENLIMHAQRTRLAPEMVEITMSATPTAQVRRRTVPWGRVVYAHDREQFIHLIEDDRGDAVAEQMARFDNHLDDLGTFVSTGPVVDFRATPFLRLESEDGTVPLLYPSHLRRGTIEWPNARAKWNAFLLTHESRRQTLPQGDYVLVKRFTAKEETRRVVAVVYEETALRTERVAFENHLNYFHMNGEGLPPDLARGLALYLNSTLVDVHFRQFSGHTQVNATDLRNMPYPSRTKLEDAGRAVGSVMPEQAEVDRLVERHLLT